MNKNKMSSMVNNFLKNSSLLKGGQKNRLVSSYVTHRNYFSNEDKNDSEIINIPKDTKNKMQSNFTQTQHIYFESELKSLDYSKSIQNNSPQQDSNKQSLIHFQQKTKKQSKLASIKQIAPQERKESIIRFDSKQEEKTTPRQQYKDQSATKIVINYSNHKDSSEKIVQKDKKSQQIISSKAKISQNKKIKQGQSNQKNPYVPSSSKQQKSRLRQTLSGDMLLQQIQSNSFNPSSPVSSMGVAKSPKYFTPQSAPKKPKLQEDTIEIDHFLNIRRDINEYLISIKQKLNGSYICIQTIQNQFDYIIDKVLQLECQKLQNTLYRLISEEINDFKEFQRREICKNKFYFMSDLFQIKCNLDLRLEQIQNFEIDLRNDYKWKNTANNILGINYDEYINGILKKSDEVQKDLILDINQNISEYIRQGNQQLNQNLKKSIKSNFITFYDGFKTSKKKNHQKIVKQLQ